MSNTATCINSEVDFHIQAASFDGLPKPRFSSNCFAKKPRNIVHRLDVIAGLRNIQDASVDIILADAPYNIGKDFGECKDKMPLKEYVRWASEWMEESLRVLKPTGTLYVYGFSEIAAHLHVASNAKFKRWLVWQYENKNSPAVTFWQRSHEAILLFAKQKPRFNTDLVRVPYTKSFSKNMAGKKRAATPSRFCNSGQETTYAVHPNGALPRDVIKIPALAGGSGAKERAHWCMDCHELLFDENKKQHINHRIQSHPTQKPIALTRRLIAAAKNTVGTTSALVLFAGSGAECIGAMMEGCEVTGFDINPDYVEMSNEWINQTSGGAV